MRGWVLLLVCCFPACFLVSPARAEEACSPVDLRALIGPPFDQGDSGYCFAHTSSSLIQAKTGLRVSPMALATSYLLTNPDELSGATDPEVQSRLTPRFFSMWHDDRTIEPENYAPDKILTENGLLNTGGDELQTILIANFTGLCDESRLPAGGDVYKKYLKQIVSFHARREQEGIPREEHELPIGEVQEPAARAQAWSFRHWVEKRCGLSRLPPVPLVPSELSLAHNLKAFRRRQSLRAGDLSGGRSRVLHAIQRQLDRGNPVAIGYALGDIMPGEKAGPSKAPADVDHASVIAGRREVNGRCYFYLRNSFGESREGYNPGMKNRTDKGGVWVLPEELPSLYSAVWLE